MVTDAEIAAFGSGAAARAQASAPIPAQSTPSHDARPYEGELGFIIADSESAAKPRRNTVAVSPPQDLLRTPSRAKPGMTFLALAAVGGAVVMYMLMRNLFIAATKDQSGVPVAAALHIDANRAPAPGAAPAAASSPAEVVASSASSTATPASDSAASVLEEATSAMRGIEPASGPSFDCRKSQLRAEMLVCSNPDLVQADLKLSSAYTTALARAPSHDKAAEIRNQQRRWLVEQRNPCDSVDCLRAAYESQTQILVSSFSEQR